MAAYTEHYGLTMPEAADPYDIGDFNENMDTIDGAMAETAAEVAGIGEKIGTPPQTGDTIFSLLAESGGGLIKSLQHIVYEVERDTSEKIFPITAVVPEKTMVIFERLADGYGSGINKVLYTLRETELELTYTGNIASQRIYGFWIVEFY